CVNLTPSLDGRQHRASRPVPADQEPKAARALHAILGPGPLPSRVGRIPIARVPAPRAEPHSRPGPRNPTFLWQVLYVRVPEMMEPVVVITVIFTGKVPAGSPRRSIGAEN